MPFVSLGKIMNSSFKALGLESPLRDLAWGELRAGQKPAPAMGGWRYLVVEAGAPVLAIGEKRVALAAPSLVVTGPASSASWAAEIPVKHFAWLWSRPAHPSLVRLGDDTVAVHPVAAAEMAELRHLHVAARNEIYRADPHSEAALTGLQFLLEARLARIFEGSHADAQTDAVKRALGWIEGHVTTRQPLAELATYLGVSPATVQRLFRDRLGTTVTRSVAAIRLREAERLMGNSGTSIKEVAYHLGYRHPHDFSRAFRNYTGKLPSRWSAGDAAAFRKNAAPRLAALERGAA